MKEFWRRIHRRARSFGLLRPSDVYGDGKNRRAASMSINVPDDPCSPPKRLESMGAAR